MQYRQQFWHHPVIKQPGRLEPLTAAAAAVVMTRTRNTVVLQCQWPGSVQVETARSYSSDSASQLSQGREQLSKRPLDSESDSEEGTGPGSLRLDVVLAWAALGHWQALGCGHSFIWNPQKLTFSGIYLVYTRYMPVTTWSMYV
jgi:hypothetical protein